MSCWMLRSFVQADALIKKMARVADRYLAAKEIRQFKRMLARRKLDGRRLLVWKNKALFADFQTAINFQPAWGRGGTR